MNSKETDSTAGTLTCGILRAAIFAQRAATGSFIVPLLSRQNCGLPEQSLAAIRSMGIHTSSKSAKKSLHLANHLAVILTGDVFCIVKVRGGGRGAVAMVCSP